ncbi:hypothetical protein [Erwinia rhapontici]|uniref:hypothetical protein n=1 Tax=Erwinia rhapontici TaxID=55212 RepID=UPI00105C9C6D|nr:hypothetical protein [Erwinia rhapontici]TDT01690.1 hypothetical protein EDF84_101417 [Erwinia rhapontici]
MSQNWNRHFELQILDEQGQGILILSDFKVSFAIQWADTRFPRVANVKIYNVSQETQARITGKEFSKIRIIAGYDGLMPVVPDSEVGVARPVTDGVPRQDGTNYGLIFSGDIRFTITGKDSITDSWVLVQAASDYNAFLFASVKKTLAAGYTVKDLLDTTMQSFRPFGVTPGIIGDMPTTVFPRGLPLYNSSRDVMDHIAGMCNGTWQMVDSQMNLVPENRYTQEAIVLNADTGLIGMPQQTMGGGVNIRCLINPNIKINGLIQIDQASVYRVALGDSEVSSAPGRTSEQDNNGNLTVTGSLQNPASIAADGVYIVKAIDYTGETRGQPWYQDMMCLARGAADLVSQSAMQRTNY